MRLNMSELQDLSEKYPKIFKDYKGNPCRVNWSFPKGWNQIVDDLCGTIQDYIDNTKKNIDGEWQYPYQIECLQVKEKFGSLRFYTNYHDDTVEGMISFAEYLSLHTCQECGSRENIGRTEGWIVVLCEDCKDKTSLHWRKDE